MALAIVSGNENRLAQPVPTTGALSESGLAMTEAIAHAVAILGMAIYHWPTACDSLTQQRGDDLLRSILPVRRLADTAAALAAAAFPTHSEITEGLANAAAMARMLAGTIEREALGRRLGAFAWLSEYVWALQGQLEAVQAGIDTAGAH